MTKSIYCCLTLILALQSPASDQFNIPTIQGRTKPCLGQFTHTRTTLSWNSRSFKCTATYTVGTHEAASWVLMVDTSKTCPYEIIEVGPVPTPKGVYVIAGFLKDHTQDIDRLNCLMYAVPKEKTVATTVK